MELSMTEAVAHVAGHRPVAAWLICGASMATYRSHLSRRIIPEFGHRALSAITAGHIESAQRAWKSDDISPTVVAGTLNCLARLFRFAIKLGDLSASPMSAVERARAGVERVTPTLMVEEVDRLAVACDQVSRRYGDYVRLAALLGLRAGELTALQVGDVNLTTGGGDHPSSLLRWGVADPELSAGASGARSGGAGPHPGPHDEGPAAGRTGAAGSAGRPALSLELSHEGAVASVGSRTGLAGAPLP